MGATAHTYGRVRHRERRRSQGCRVPRSAGPGERPPGPPGDVFTAGPHDGGGARADGARRSSGGLVLIRGGFDSDEQPRGGPSEPRGKVQPRRPASPGVRLTRRGRVVLIVTVAAVLLGGLWLTAGRWALAGSKSGREAPSTSATERLKSVTVGQDDTLWAIASRARPDADPRITVRRIIDLNSLSDPIVHPGQRLLLPSK
jgi:hypothetical protein